MLLQKRNLLPESKGISDFVFIFSKVCLQSKSFVYRQINVSANTTLQTVLNDLFYSNLECVPLEVVLSKKAGSLEIEFADFSFMIFFEKERHMPSKAGIFITAKMIFFLQVRNVPFCNLTS